MATGSKNVQGRRETWSTRYVENDAKHKITCCKFPFENETRISKRPGDFERVQTKNWKNQQQNKKKTNITNEREKKERVLA